MQASGRLPPRELLPKLLDQPRLRGALVGARPRTGPRGSGVWGSGRGRGHTRTIVHPDILPPRQPQDRQGRVASLQSSPLPGRSRPAPSFGRARTKPTPRPRAPHHPQRATTPQSHVDNPFACEIPERVHGRPRTPLWWRPVGLGRWPAGVGTALSCTTLSAGGSTWRAARSHGHRSRGHPQFMRLWSGCSGGSFRGLDDERCDRE